MTSKQQILLNRLFEILVELNEEAINDDDFNIWLNENYFFNEELEEIIIKLKEININYN